PVVDHDGGGAVVDVLGGEGEVPTELVGDVEVGDLERQPRRVAHQTLDLRREYLIRDEHQRTALLHERTEVVATGRFCFGHQRGDGDQALRQSCILDERGDLHVGDGERDVAKAPEV